MGAAVFGPILGGAGGGAAGGAWTLISSVTASTSSTIDFTSGIAAGTARYYKVEFEGVFISGVSTLLARVGTSSAFISTSNYFSTTVRSASSGTTVTGSNSASDDSMQIVANNLNAASTTTFSGEVYLDIGQRAQMRWAAQVFDNGGNTVQLVGGGSFNAAITVERLQFFPSSGTFDGGTFHLYSLTDS